MTYCHHAVPVLALLPCPNDSWRASRNPQDLEKALEDVVNKAMEKRRKYQQRQKQNQPQGRQAPQWNQQQAQGRKPVPQPTAHEPRRGKYADAAEQQPDLGSMSVRELRGFILQVCGTFQGLHAATCQSVAAICSKQGARD